MMMAMSLRAQAQGSIGRLGFGTNPGGQLITKSGKVRRSWPGHWHECGTALEASKGV